MTRHQNRREGQRHQLVPIARPGLPEPASRHRPPPLRSPATVDTPDSAIERVVRTLGLLAVTSAVGWLLTTDLVSGPLTIPLTSLDELRRWLDDSTPAIVPAALLRLAALAGCTYLTLALVLTLVAQILDRRTGGRALRAVRRLLPAALHRSLAGGAHFSLFAATAFPVGALPVAAGHAGPPDPTATMTKLDPIEAAGELPPPPVASPTATMTRLPAASGSAVGHSPTTTSLVVTIAPTTAPTSLAPVPPPPRPPAPAPSPNPGDEPPDHAADLAGVSAASDDTWTVTPGDTFWSIAEETLADHRGSYPPQDEVVRYWRRLIATNQARLAAPGNPDLLLPGQALVLPPPG